MDIQQQINEMQSRQLELRAIMASSDERAAKCTKSGVSFREAYPEDFARYEAANEEYNANEITLATLQEQAAREAELAALNPPMEVVPEPETEPEVEPEPEPEPELKIGPETDFYPEADGVPEVITLKVKNQWTGQR